MKDEIVTILVWVRLLYILVNFYYKTILIGIVKGLRRSIKVDGITLNFERVRFARICVEVNFNKLLKGLVMINGERYYVFYEGMLIICSICGLYGYFVYVCFKNVTNRVFISIFILIFGRVIMNYESIEIIRMDVEFISVR